jgi:16S rRNA (cytosine1402-N4)-methyltransferase
MKNNLAYHVPVLLEESVAGLNLYPDALVVDATFGGGGHSALILSKLGPKGKLFAIDQDADAHANGFDAPNFKPINGNFQYLKNHLAMQGVSKVDAILADIGVSSHQFDAAERGFSLRTNGQLDMRMNRKNDNSAASVLNAYSESDLLTMFRSYSDISNAYRLVQQLLAFRNIKPFEFTEELVRVSEKCAPKTKEHKYIAQVFQALRIEVNQEIEALKALLLASAEVLNPGGRMVVISYHSIEDRLVKNFFKRGSFDGEITKDFFGNVQKPFEEWNRHPLVPTDAEIERNSRARSAKLRIATKK